MAKIKEFQKKAEDLVEKGDEKKAKTSQCQAQVSKASARVQAAREKLEMEQNRVDDEGNPCGNVSGAQTMLRLAENGLAASRRALDVAREEEKRVEVEKRNVIYDIDRYTNAEKTNIQKLSSLKNKAFGNVAASLEQNLAAKANQAAAIKAALLKSMGKGGSAENINAGGGASGGFGGSAFSERGSSRGDSEGTAAPPVAAPVGGGLPSSADTSFHGMGTYVGANGDTFVSGPNTRQYLADQQMIASGQMVRKKYENGPETVWVDPENIEGIYLDGSGNFWDHHANYDEYKEAASGLGELKQAYDAKADMNELKSAGGSLGASASAYFDSGDPITVINCGSYYEFDRGGRHRTLMARMVNSESGQHMKIPVQVTGSLVYR